MSILGAVIVPHPPLIIPTVGRGQEQEVQAIIDAYRTATKQVAECGLRSFQIMAGALDGQAVEAKLLSYEDVTGVGYGVATFAVTDPDENRRFGEQCEAMERTRLAEKRPPRPPTTSSRPFQSTPLRGGRRSVRCCC